MMVVSNQYIGVIFIIIIIAIALKTITTLATAFPLPLLSGRHNSIDGLRGVAALLVFACHATAWHYYIIDGRWSNYPIKFYGNIGQFGVIIFFMITGFLFTSKLLKERGNNRQVDWKKWLISRIFRLAPLYAFTIIIVLLVALRLRDSPPGAFYTTIGHPFLNWLLFTIPGTPDINGLKDTWLVTAGVTWSLPYEWFFYCTLPVFATLIGRRPSWSWLIGSFATAAIIFIASLKTELLLPFIGGIITAFLVRRPRIVAVSLRTSSSLIALLFLCIAVGFFWNLIKPLPLVLITIFFAVTACGNNFFGVLDNRAVRLLGEISYSVYLLHGLTLYILFNEIIGLANAKAMHPLHYWLTIVAITPFIILTCTATFLLIERPMMKLAGGRHSCQAR